MALTQVLTGGIKADAVDNTILKLDDNFAFTGTVTGAGKVVQIVQGTKVTSNAVTNTSFAASGLNVAITPSSSSNKVLVICTWWAGYPSTNNGQTYTLYRGSTNLDQSSNRTGFNQIGSSVDNGNETYQGLAMSLHFLDSPSTTSATTYELYHKMDGGTGYFNMNQNGDSASKQTCVITAMEIT